MKNQNVQEYLSKKYPIPDALRDSHPYKGKVGEEFDRLYDEAFRLENDDKTIDNPYHESAKLNCRMRNKGLPRLFPRRHMSKLEKPALEDEISECRSEDLT